jgi:GLPGLI family protein
MKRSTLAFVVLALFGLVAGQASVLGQDSLSTTVSATEAAESAPPASDLLSGTVIYQETRKFDIELPPQMRARMRENFDDTRTASVVVLFDESTSLSQLAPEQADESEAAGGGRRFRMFAQRPDNATFIDFENDTAIQRREFLERIFLVEGATKPAWKLTTDQSEFLGYVCHRAIATVDSSLVEAWFTPEIPVPAGPDEYYGLPGLILVLTTDDGNLSFVATDVSLRPIDPAAIAAPTEGRKVTREEFDKIVADKMKEMEGSRGRGRVLFRN